MAQLKRVDVEVVLPVLWNGWTLLELTNTLRSLAAQECLFDWRVSLVDASRSDTVQNVARGVLPENRLSYDTLHLRTGMHSDLLYQGVSSCRAKYITYCSVGAVWDRAQLSHLVGAAVQSKSDVIVQDGQFASVDQLARMVERNEDPAAGSLVLHSAKAYDASAGWPRLKSTGFSAPLWRSMFITGSEFFSVPRLGSSFVRESTSQPNQLMLFGDA